jgi:hypothetical protein
MSTFCKVRTSILVALFAAVPFTAAVQAEDMNTTVVVNVPFAFEDGAQHFSAGRYTIGISPEHIATIENRARKDYAMTWFDRSLDPAKTSKVVFEKYGDHYFLSKIYVAGDTSHVEFPTTKREKLEMASIGGSSSNVEVAALEPPH